MAQLAGELSLHIIDVHARADDPAPWLEQLNIRSLGHRFVGTGLGPAVIDRACALAAGEGSHFVEYGETVRVANGGEVLAVELGVGRVHDHFRPQIVDPEVVVLVVAQRAHHLQGLLLGSIAAERAGGLQALVIRQHARSGLHHMAGFLRLGLVQVAMDLTQHQQAEDHQHCHRNQQYQPQTAADRHRPQGLHERHSRIVLFMKVHPSMLWRLAKPD